MRFHKIEDQIITSDKDLTIGTKQIENSVEAVQEKHVAMITVNGNEAHGKVGSIEHPGLDMHYIERITLVTGKGMQMRWLKPGMKPKRIFKLIEEEKVVAAHEYCKSHGLWKVER